MWKTFSINLNWINFLVSSSKKYLGNNGWVNHFDHLLNMGLCYWFWFFILIWHYIVWKESLHFSRTDFFNFFIDWLDKRKIQELSHNFSFSFPSWTFWKSDRFTDHSLKLIDEHSVFSESFFTFNFIELLGKLRIHQLNVGSVNKVTDNNIVFWPLIFQFIMTILIGFSWIKSYWSYFCIERNKA